GGGGGGGGGGGERERGGGTGGERRGDVLHNRAHWDKQAPGYVPSAELHWAQPTPSWGIWSVPEAGLRMIPDDIEGKSAIELGCGTAYVSAWLARQGAHVVGIDNSEQQLTTE